MEQGIQIIGGIEAALANLEEHYYFEPCAVLLDEQCWNALSRLAMKKGVAREDDHPLTFASVLGLPAQGWVGNGFAIVVQPKQGGGVGKRVP